MSLIICISLFRISKYFPNVREDLGDFFKSYTFGRVFKIWEEMISLKLSIAPSMLLILPAILWRSTLLSSSTCKSCCSLNSKTLFSSERMNFSFSSWVQQEFNLRDWRVLEFWLLFLDLWDGLSFVVHLVLDQFNLRVFSLVISWDFYLFLVP